MEGIELVEPDPDMERGHLFSVHIHARKMQTGALGLELAHPHDAARSGKPKQTRNLEIEFPRSRRDQAVLRSPGLSLRQTRLRVCGECFRGRFNAKRGKAQNFSIRSE